MNVHRKYYETTGQEIWEQSGGKVDAFIASQGTGGTITGVGRFLREKNPKVKLYALSPLKHPFLRIGNGVHMGLKELAMGLFQKTLT